MPSARLATLLTTAATLALAPPALGAWSHSGSGAQTARAVTMPTGSTPTVSVSNRDVTVSWAASTFSGGGQVSGYTVKRYDSSGNAQTIGSGCSGTVTATTCTETSVPAGTWKYTVTPKQGNWSGGESSQSSGAVVAAPALAFTSSTTVSSLPATLAGNLSGYVPGQTVTFRLDDPASGTTLSSSVSPSTIPSSGNATFSVTIPSGTSNGSHTVYAVGSGSDTASAAISVLVTSTVSSPAFDLRDASSGSETNVSSPSAFAADGLTFNTGNWPSAFSNTQYVDFNLSAPLPAGLTVSGAAFKFNYAATASSDTACFWFDVRHASNGNLIAQHGSPASPVSCVTGTTLTPTTTSIPELSTSDLANDARVRVYVSNSGLRPITVDLATITGSTPSTSFTLYARSYTDAATGAGTTSVWSLAGSDTSFYTDTTNWPGSANTTRYLKVTFPGYVPTGATVTSASLTHSYRASRSGNTACFWVQVYAGATPIGSHGSSTSAYSCNSTTTFLSETIALPEVNTAARANSVVVRVYYTVTGGGSRTTDTDLASLSVSYQ